MIPRDMVIYREGNMQLRVDTLDDNRKVYWLQSGHALLQVKEEELRNVNKLINKVSGPLHKIGTTLRSHVVILGATAMGSTIGIWIGGGF